MAWRRGADLGGITRASGTAALLLLAAGCALPPTPGDDAALEVYAEANDPLEPMNRYFFEVNHFLDEILLKPFAGYYHTALPDFAEDAVRNVVRNLHAPTILANDLFQGEFGRAGDTAGRFLVNSTVGVGGLIDVGERLGMRYHSEDFGQTLGTFGVGEGFYVILPLLGPSNTRDSVGRVVDYLLDPLTWVGYGLDLSYINLARVTAEGLDTRARNLDTLSKLQQQSVDFYATIRSLYRQHRSDAINDGQGMD